MEASLALRFESVAFRFRASAGHVVSPRGCKPPAVWLWRFDSVPAHCIAVQWLRGVTGSMVAPQAVGGGSKPLRNYSVNPCRPPALLRIVFDLRGAFRMTGSTGTGWLVAVAQLGRAPNEEFGCRGFNSRLHTRASGNALRVRLPLLLDKSTTSGSGRRSVASPAGSCRVARRPDDGCTRRTGTNGSAKQSGGYRRATPALPAPPPVRGHALTGRRGTWHSQVSTASGASQARFRLRRWGDATRSMPRSTNAHSSRRAWRHGLNRSSVRS